jgi:hypothetical protein
MVFSGIISTKLEEMMPHHLKLHLEYFLKTNEEGSLSNSPRP